MPAHHGKFVSYYRVSTDKQGKSGLGLDAQKAAVADRLNGGRWQIVGEFTEIESGKRASRPQLEAAIAACKKHKAKLIVAKLDRLSRDVGFIHKLIGSGVEVLFADLPDLNGAMGKFVLITMANVAELEAGSDLRAHQGGAESCQGERREARPSRCGGSRSQVSGGGSPEGDAARAHHS